MDTEIKNAVNATGQDAQYDEKAKRLLGNKIILAHILVKTVDEFRGMNPKDVVSYIEGEPFISVVPVEPGLTNAGKEKDGLLGFYEWEGKIDLLNIVLIGLSKELPGHDEKYELHRLLGALLSKNLSSDEKLDIIEAEYDILIEDNIRKDVNTMCNLSQGIREDATDTANVKIIMNMHRKSYTSEQIAEIVEKSIEEVEAIIENREPVMA